MDEILRTMRFGIKTKLDLGRLDSRLRPAAIAHHLGLESFGNALEHHEERPETLQYNSGVIRSPVKSAGKTKLERPKAVRQIRSPKTRHTIRIAFTTAGIPKAHLAQTIAACLLGTHHEGNWLVEQNPHYDRTIRRIEDLLQRAHHAQLKGSYQSHEELEQWNGGESQNVQIKAERDGTTSVRFITSSTGPLKENLLKKFSRWSGTHYSPIKELED